MNIHYLDNCNQGSSASAGMKHDLSIASTRDARQLELDLGDRTCRLLKIAVTESIHGKTLATILDDLVPEFVLDLREVLRFDLPGLSRDAFFNMLSVRGVHYARAPVGWHGMSPRAMTTGGTLPSRLHHEAVERWGGNLVLLVSRLEHASYMQALLNMTLSSKRPSGWHIEQVF